MFEWIPDNVAANFLQEGLLFNEKDVIFTPDGLAISRQSIQEECAFAVDVLEKSWNRISFRKKCNAVIVIRENPEMEIVDMEKARSAYQPPENKLFLFRGVKELIMVNRRNGKEIVGIMNEES